MKIDDVNADTMETMLFFMYNDSLDKKLINSELLFLADKYNVEDLIAICVEHLTLNLCHENALDVFLTSHLTSQEKLFDTVTKYILQNQSGLYSYTNKKSLDTEELEKLLDDYPKLATDVAKNVFHLKEKKDNNKPDSTNSN